MSEFMTALSTWAEVLHPCEQRILDATDRHRIGSREREVVLNDTGRHIPCKNMLYNGEHASLTQGWLCRKKGSTLPSLHRVALT